MSTTWSVMFLIGGILFFLGGLIGSTMTVQAMGAKWRQQAAMQRRLNAQWQEIQDARHRRYGRSNLQWLRQEEPPFVDGDVTVVSDNLLVRT